MEIFAIAGWIVAAICGAGWWISHRGLAGIKRDLADAKREVEKRVKKS